jgi:plasmid stabilization system protein ParE
VLAASAFLRELSTAVQRVRQDPGRYPAAEAGTLRILFERFPFTLYYRVQSDKLTVVAVAPSEATPCYWSER